MESLMDKIQKVKELWDSIIPNVPAPHNREIALWVTNFEPQIFEHGIVRTSARFRTYQGDPEIAHRYATGVMTNETKRLRVSAGMAGAL